MSERESIRVVVFTHWEYDPASYAVCDIISSLQQILMEIPEEYRSEAECEIERDDYCTIVKIIYFRPETDEEMKKRVFLKSLPNRGFQKYPISSREDL